MVHSKLAIFVFGLGAGVALANLARMSPSWMPIRRVDGPATSVQFDAEKTVAKVQDFKQRGVLVLPTMMELDCPYIVQVRLSTAPDNEVTAAKAKDLYERCTTSLTAAARGIF